ncbi:MAG: YggS family pyridoxal phosphate-dependent enzyme [Chitinophagales bacterium]|nr:YggS family pyridoxal phosphate-dependent enzyme [Chitinophagales bacterium]
MEDIYHSIHTFLTEKNVQLVAVSKTKPIDAIMTLYDAGQRDFGENRIQELKEKQPLLPADIRWHLIGHLQSNKVKYIIPYIHLIHSVDSLQLLSEINKQAEKSNRVIPCLLQVYIAKEESKSGLHENEITAVLDSSVYASMKNITIQGLMGMATNTSDETIVRGEFRQLKQLFDQIKEKYFVSSPHFSHISMGMSNDYKIAVEEGSTMVRLGSLLFGNRN